MLRLIKCVRSGPKRPFAAVPANRVAVDAGGGFENAPSGSLLLRRALPAAVGRGPTRQNPLGCPRKRAAASWRAACRNTARTGRERFPIRCGSIHISIHAIRNQVCLPASSGTQKLWSVSAESSFKNVGVGCAGSLTGMCSSFAVTMPSFG